MSPDPGVHYIGNYKIVLVDGSNGYGSWATLKFMFVAIKESLLMRKQRKLDIVISYDPFATGVTASIIKIVSGAKMICEVNGVYDSEEIYKFRSDLKLKFKKFLYPKIQQRVLKFSDGVKTLFPGQISRFSLRKNTVEACFFDYSNITAGDYRENQDHYLLTLGFPAYIKGVDVLIGAFQRLTTDFPLWKLLIVGWFTSKEVKEMNEQAAGNKNIEIRKPVPFAEIPQLMDSCDIFVLPSRTEAMGRVLIEAMARGRARIASRVNGIPTVVNDGEDGLLFEKENIDELEMHLRNLMKSEAARRQFAEKGLRRFENEFTLKHYAAHVKNLFDRVDANRDVAN
ncbi:glycosyltransferase family 4 protein [Aurantivibrio infirmus]